MDYSAIPLTSVDKDFILGLIENKVDESTTLDYKMHLSVMKADKKKIDYLKDVCSFSNTRGGLIIWGVKEKDGVPVEVVGVEEGVIDQVILQMEQLISTGIEPSVPGVQTKRISVGDKNCVVQRVPRSLLSPHMISYNQYDKFYTRLSRSNDKMDYAGIKRSFLTAENRMDSLRRFRNERITNIVSQEVPVVLEHTSLYVVHVLPIVAIEIMLSPSDIRAKGQLFQPLRSDHAGTPTINFDGVVFHDGSYREENTSTYCQVFRSGVVEGVGPISYNSADRIPSIDIESNSIDRIRGYIQGLSDLGVPYPFAVGISMIGVKGFKIFKGNINHSGRVHSIKENLLRVPEVVLESAEDRLEDIMKTPFDRIWNAGGQQGTPYYRAEGNWGGLD